MKKNWMLFLFFAASAALTFSGCSMMTIAMFLKTHIWFQKKYRLHLMQNIRKLKTWNGS